MLRTHSHIAQKKVAEFNLFHFGAGRRITKIAYRFSSLILEAMGGTNFFLKKIFIANNDSAIILAIILAALQITCTCGIFFSSSFHHHRQRVFMPRAFFSTFSIVIWSCLRSRQFVALHVCFTFICTLLVPNVIRSAFIMHLNSIHNVIAPSVMWSYYRFE